MSSPANKRAEERRVKHERQDIHDGILAVTLAWGTLEDTMARLLSMLLSPGPYPRGVGAAIYFASDNAATRFDIVDAAFRATMSYLVHDVFMAALPGLHEWSAFTNSLGRSRRARNQIIHSVIREMEVGREKRITIRLTPSELDHERMSRVKPGQLPGLSGADVDGVAAKISYLTAQTKLFRRMARFVHDTPKELPLVIAELVERRQRQGDPPANDPTPPKQ